MQIYRTGYTKVMHGCFEIAPLTQLILKSTNYLHKTDLYVLSNNMSAVSIYLLTGRSWYCLHGT